MTVRTILMGLLLASVLSSAAMTAAKRGTRTRDVFGVLFVTFYIATIVVAILFAE